MIVSIHSDTIPLLWLTIVVHIGEFIRQVDGVAVVLCQQPRVDQLSVCLWDLRSELVSEEIHARIIA